MKSFITFLAMLLIVLVFTYLTGAPTSMVMIYMLVLCVPFSFFLTWPLRKCFEVQIETPSGEVEKNGIIKMQILISNKSFLPAPFVHIALIKPEILSALEVPSDHLSFSPYETKRIEAKFRAERRGIAEVGLKEVTLKDFLGFFSYSLLKDLEPHQYTGRITVLPKITPMRPSSRILQGSQDKGTMSNESESIHSPVIALTGEPGYEYREYQTGDPLHRVHWKLSARTDQLMVRVGEGMGTSRICLILDPCSGHLAESGSAKARSGSPDPLRQAEDTLLEALLSVVQMIIRMGRHAEVWLYHNELWQVKTITHRKELLDLQRLLAEYRFVCDTQVEGGSRLPLSTMTQRQKMNRSFHGGEAVLFTASCDAHLHKEMDGTQSISLKLIHVRQSKQALETPSSDFPAGAFGLLWSLNAGDDLSLVAI